MTESQLQKFEAYRPLMFSIAYRMMGSINDAEDVVQKAYLRVQSVHEEIVSPHAYFSTIVTRLCLNQLQLAQVQREEYIGQWLPEPLFTSPDMPDSLPTPAEQAELHDTISLAFMTLLEQLSPLERAVFLLREVFDYTYDEIAQILDKEEATCRQLLSRAKKHLKDQRPRFKPSPEAHREMLDQFIYAVDQGDMDGLLNLLSQDVVLWADGGGKVRGAIYEPLKGQRAVGRFIMVSPSFATTSFTREIMDVNGTPSLVLRVKDKISLVLSITVEADRINAIHVVANPDKLTALNAHRNGKAGA